MVVYIVCGSYLQASRSKLNVHVIVFNHGYFTTYQRHDNMLAFQPSVLRVVRIDAHGGVAHNRFGACSGYHGVFSWFFDHHIFKVEELGVLFLVHHFFVGECRLCLGVPVNHANAAVNQSLFVEIAEHFEDAFRAFVVHGECRSVPIARCAQASKLFKDDATVFVCPVPRVF